MSMATVLIVDDEPNILTSLKRAVEVEGYQALVAGSGSIGLEKVQSEGPDLVLLDVVMPEMDGLQVLEMLRQQQPDLPVVMMIGNATIEAAVQATRLGAVDFIEKPISTERILITMQNALQMTRLRQENVELRQRTGGEQEMIGESPAMRRIFDTIDRAAPSQGRVLICGPNGTGKELVARAIHRLSRRAEGPFIKVNCAAIPGELIESELFGHEKGAFTGATGMRKGKFELAHGGTLLLDEIGDMSLDAQAKVLRALQESEIERVGGSQVIKVDVRVIAATNKDLPAEIEAGKFREDLYYRLNVVPIQVPALREHKEDIPALCRLFLGAACLANDKQVDAVDDPAVTLLMQHDWPGNVRELKNLVERLVILAAGQTITAEDVRDALPNVRSAGQGHYQRGVSLKDMLASTERELITSALRDNEGHVARTAAELQVERSHLYKKMRGLGIDPRSLG